MGESWRGEHLIRSKPYKPVDRFDRPPSRGGSMVARPPAVGPFCAVPGCGASISERNGSKVCKRHTHLAGYCQCGQCVRRRAAE